MDIRELGSRALCSATRNIIVSHRELENLNTLLLRIYSQNRAHEISALVSLTRFSRTSESGRTHLILTTNSHPFGKREVAPKVNERITSSSRSQHAPILTARSQSVPRLTVKPNVARLTHPELPDLVSKRFFSLSGSLHMITHNQPCFSVDGLRETKGRDHRVGKYLH